MLQGKIRIRKLPLRLIQMLPIKCRRLRCVSKDESLAFYMFVCVMIYPCLFACLCVLLFTKEQGPGEMWSQSTWPQPYPQFTQDEYAATHMQHQLQMQANYQYWQSMQTFPPPQVQHEYGPFMPGMYPPVHQRVQQFSSNTSEQRRNSWYGQVPDSNWSAGSSESFRSLGIGRSKSNKSRKSRREKDNEQQAVASSYDASMTLHQIKGGFSLMLSSE